MVKNNMKIITKDTGISIAVVGTIVAVAVYVTIAQATISARIQEQEDVSANIKAEILQHETTDKEALTVIRDTHVTKSEIDLETKVIETKLDALNKSQVADNKRLETKLDRVEAKIDLILAK